jgi:hypothetical protein
MGVGGLGVSNGELGNGCWTAGVKVSAKGRTGSCSTVADSSIALAMGTGIRGVQNTEKYGRYRAVLGSIFTSTKEKLVRKPIFRTSWDSTYGVAGGGDGVVVLSAHE